MTHSWCHLRLQSLTPSTPRPSAAQITRLSSSRAASADPGTAICNPGRGPAPRWAVCELTSGRRAQWQVTTAERQLTGGLHTSVWDQLSGGRPGGTMLGRVGALVNKSWSESERSAQPPGCNPHRRGGRQVRRREARRVSRLALLCCYWLDHPGVAGSGEMEGLDW